MDILKDKKMIVLSLTILAILLAAAAALWLQVRSGPEDGLETAGTKTALLYQNGQLLRRIPLTKDADNTFTIESDEGGSNTIQVAHGKIGIIDADCPDKLCVKMGMVSSAAYPISCLPHRLVIQIEDDKEETPVDAVTQ